MHLDKRTDHHQYVCHFRITIISALDDYNVELNLTSYISFNRSNPICSKSLKIECICAIEKVKCFSKFQHKNIAIHIIISTLLILKVIN